MNPTMRKFGYPDSVLREYRHWAVLLRPRQATLGALVLACKEPVTEFGQVSVEGFAELQAVTRALEGALRQAFEPERLNYLMLMMVDPDVHFHVLPRYSRSRELAGVRFADPGWPGPPDIAYCTETDRATREQIAEVLEKGWPDEG